MPWNVGLKWERNVIVCVLTYVGDGVTHDFRIPDGIEEMTIEAWGAPGGFSPWQSQPIGYYLKATFPVVAGDWYTAYPGTGPTGATRGQLRMAGWPNGGYGGWDENELFHGYGGGGSSSVRPQGGSFTDSLIVAAGAGGNAGNNSDETKLGGDGGFTAGADGEAGTGTATGGGGGTSVAGGAGGDAGVLFGLGNPGNPGSFGQGGDGADDPSLDLGMTGGGGGGGGWYGGGGGGSGYPAFFPVDGDADGGGGGSSHLDGAGTLVDDGPSDLTYGQIVVTFC